MRELSVEVKSTADNRLSRIVVGTAETKTAQRLFVFFVAPAPSQYKAMWGSRS